MLTLKEAFSSKLNLQKKQVGSEDPPNVEDQITKEYTIMFSDNKEIIVNEEILSRMACFKEIISRKRQDEDRYIIRISDNELINFYAFKAIVRYYLNECKLRYLLSSLSTSLCTVEILFETMKTLSIYFEFTVYELPCIEDCLREILNKIKVKRKKMNDSARDMVFSLLYAIQLKQFEGNREEEQRVYNNVIFIQNHPREFGRRLRAHVWSFYNRHYITSPTRTDNIIINYELSKSTDNISNSDVSESENEEDSDSDKEL